MSSAGSGGVAVLAADRKARLAAKAAQAQKPIAASGASRPIEETPKAMQMREQPAQRSHATQPHPEQQQNTPSNTTSAGHTHTTQQNNTLPPKNTFHLQQPYYPAYTDDMDDMDATMYIDQGNALQLTRKAPPPSTGRSNQLAPASSRPAASRSPDWEDEVETFQASTPSAGLRSVPMHQEERSPTHVYSSAVAVLDSADEERRLDALRGRAARADESFDDHDLDYAESAPTPKAAPATGATGSSSWVDQQARSPGGLVSVRGRDEGRSDAAPSPVASPPPADSDDAHETQITDRTDDPNQPYLRGQHRTDREPAGNSAAGSSAQPASPTMEVNNARQVAYLHQMKLQREAIEQMNQKAASGSMTADEQRQMMMISKRPPLILDWSHVDPKELFNSAVPRGGWLQCRLIKRSSGLKAFLHPRYELYTEEHQGGLFLATARKSSKTKPNYHLTMEKFNKGEDKPIEKTSEMYAGKVAATLSRSDYLVFDSGFNPNKSSDSAFSKHPREEIGHISYKPHLSGKTPRKLAVLLPIMFPESHKDGYVSTEFKNEFLSSSSAYSHLWKSLKEAQQRARVPRAWLCLLNKPPRYHADTGNNTRQQLPRCISCHARAAMSMRSHLSVPSPVSFFSPLLSPPRPVCA